MDEAADVSIDIAASADEVWAALTTADGLAPWMGEGASIDLRPGGPVVLPDPVGGATRRGRVDRIDEGQRLDITWWPALRPAERSTVHITVTPTVIPGDGRKGATSTRVRVIERLALEPTAGGRARVQARVGVARMPVGLWSWRLAVLSVCGCLSRI